VIKIVSIKNLKLLRKALKLSQENMARKLNISNSYYSHLESGKRKISLDLAYKISCIFNLTIEEVFFAEKQSVSYSCDQKEVS